MMVCKGERMLDGGVHEATSAHPSGTSAVQAHTHTYHLHIDIRTHTSAPGCLKITLASSPSLKSHIHIQYVCRRGMRER